MFWVSVPSGEPPVIEPSIRATGHALVTLLAADKTPSERNSKKEGFGLTLGSRHCLSWQLRSEEAGHTASVIRKLGPLPMRQCHP